MYYYFINKYGNIKIKDSKMNYLMQIRTPDFGIQLKTEVVANSISNLQFEAKEMLKNLSQQNREKISGKEYGIYQLSKLENGKIESKMLKIGKIS